MKSAATETGFRLSQMSEIVDRQGDAQKLSQAVERLAREISKATEDYVRLRNACRRLAREAGELRALGEGRYWTSRRLPRTEYSLQVVSKLRKKLLTNAPFSFRLRVIDRHGACLPLCPSDTFELKVTSTKSRKSKRSSDMPTLAGTTRVTPLNREEVEFCDVRLTLDTLPVSGVRVHMEVSSCSNPLITPLELEPVLLKPQRDFSTQNRLSLEAVPGLL